MLGVLPFIALALLLPLCRQFTDSWRSAVLAASIVWGIAVAAMTEILSPFRALSFTPLAALWAAACLGLLLGNVAVLRGGRIPMPSGWSHLSLANRVLLAATGFIVLTCGVIAVIAPPNNWDGFVFHMTRVEHWAQNGSVAHYPTHVVRELNRHPWTAYVLLHLRILSEGDRLANLVQWLAMVGSLIGVSLITRELGGGVRGQVLAVAVAVTIPLGILEASSNQTDYTGAYWMVCLVYLLLAAMQSTPVVRSLAAHRLLVGGSLGLALLTKGTSYLHALPFLVWFVLSQVRRDVAGLLRTLTVMAVMAGIINAGFILRNVQLFGSLFGPGGEEECEYCGLANETITGPIFVSNVLRNIGTNLGTPSAGVNEYMTAAITAAHRAMGISPNDQRSTWWKMSFFVVPPQFDENTEGNLVHLLLILGTIGLLFLKRKELGLVKPYVISLTGAFLLMSLLLKWGPSQSRYQLGLFVLWTPVIGWALERLRRPVVANLTVAGLFVLAMPWLLLNSNRPLLGDRTIWNTPPEEQLFMSRFTRPYMAMFADAAVLLRREHCSKVGVIRRQTDFEYPLWVMLRNQPGETLRLEEMLVENVSNAAATPRESQEFRPCAIVTISYSNVTNVSLVKPDDRVFH